MIYWHKIKLEMQGKAQRLNDTAERHGDGRTQDESLLQFHTLPEIEQALLGLFGITTIRKAITLLNDAEIISKHKNPNPRYSYDQTTFYLLNTQLIDRFLERYATRLPGSTQITPPHSPTTHPSVVDNRSMSRQQRLEASPTTITSVADTSTSTEITTKTTTKTTAAPSVAEDKPITNEFAAANSLFKKTPTKPAQIEQQIGSSLTSAQTAYLQKRLTALTPHVPFNHSLPALCQAVSNELTNTASFSQAGTDFFKKLNTVLKLIKQGEWRPNEVGQGKEPSAEKIRVDEIRSAISDCLSKRQCLLGFVSFLQEQGNQPDTLADNRQQLTVCESKLARLRAELIKHTPPQTRLAA